MSSLQSSTHLATLSTQENTPFNQLSFIGSHNSYDQDYDIITQITKFGCREVELDVNQSSDEKYWSVNHNFGYHSDAELQIEAYLQPLYDWHNLPGNDQHDPIVLFLDLKSPNDTTAESIIKLETNIRRVFTTAEDAIFKPSDLIGNCRNLYEGAMMNGWPTLSQLRGKIILVISGNEDAKENYANYEPAERLCFADVDDLSFPMDMKQNRVFYNYRDFDTAMVRDQAYNNASFIRCFAAAKSNADAQKGLFDGALECGVNIISIDCFDRDWAQLDADSQENYIRLKPLAAKRNLSKESAFWLKSFHHSKVMDLKNGSSDNRTPVGDWDRNNSYNQLWYAKEGSLWNKASGTVLDLDNGDTNLQGYDHQKDEANQDWRLELNSRYCLSSDPSKGRALSVSNQIEAGDYEYFTFEALTADELESLPEQARKENNLHFIKSFDNRYLGFKSNDTLKPEFYASKANLQTLCYLRWNARHQASVVLFTGNKRQYLGIEKDILSIDADQIGTPQILTITESTEQAGRYTISDSFHETYRIVNRRLNKYVTYNEGQLLGKNEDGTNNQVWVKIEAGVAVGKS